MNEYEAKLHVSRTVTQILLDVMDDGAMSDAEFLALAEDASAVVDELFRELELEVVKVEAPDRVVLRIRVDRDA